MKIRLSGLALLAIAGACARGGVKDNSRPAPAAGEQARWACMGAPWIVRAEPGLSGALRRSLERECRRYEMVFSDWSEDSELRRLEQGGLRGWHQASPLFIEGLRLADRAWRETSGAFDISMGAVIWKRSERATGLAGLRIEPGRFRFREDPLRLSFGGIAKGMAVGALARILARDPLIESFSIDAGGGNAAEGDRAAGRFTWISRSATKPGPAAHILDPSAPAVAIDARSALRCFTAWSAADRAAEDSAMTDAWTTALVIRPSLAAPSGCLPLRD